MAGWSAPAVDSQVRLAAAGDEVAFARIVELHNGDMARVAYGICGDRSLAEDAVQAAWTIAWRRLHTLRDPERLRPWLVAVAANEARHIARHRHRRPVVEIDLHDPVAGAPDPADEIGLVDLGNALGHLSPEDRSLIVLRYGVGFGSGEIGPMLGISPSGVRTRLARVVRRLREELEDV